MPVANCLQESYTVRVSRLEKPAFASLFVTLAVAMSPFGTPPVLCVGENGHVAIESGGRRGCVVGHDHERETSRSETGCLETADPVRDRHCGSCEDFSISEEWRPQENEDRDLWHPRALAVSPWSSLFVAAALDVSGADLLSSPVQVNPGGPGHLVLLRTVVLLS